MDLKIYYQKVKQVEAGISEPHVVVVSQETPDGGKAGQMTEVTRTAAARLVVEGRARIGSPEETAAFRSRVAEAKKIAEEAAVANRMQIAVVGDSELKALKSALRSKA